MWPRLESSCNVMNNNSEVYFISYKPSSMVTHCWLLVLKLLTQWSCVYSTILSRGYNGHKFRSK